MAEVTQVAHGGVQVAQLEPLKNRLEAVHEQFPLFNVIFEESMQLWQFVAVVTQVAQGAVQVGQDEPLRYLPAEQDVQLFDEPPLHVAHDPLQSVQVPELLY